ncbi:MAG: peptide chain release factor 1 [Candidatus Omnitrophica bacterium]|nr:peptide chain release factor 1 [Candidatus Omnitrophota bacterium]
MNEANLLEVLKKIEQRYEELEHFMALPETISNKGQYNQYAKEIAGISGDVFLFRQFKQFKAEIIKLQKTLEEKHDQDFLELLESEIKELGAKSEQILDKIKGKLEGGGEEEDKNIIVEIRAATGGQEASLFAAVLYRMYTKYAQKHGWAIEMMASHPTELGGFKEVIFSVRGKQAYQHLRWESGVHRVQRVPATETQGRIHTSTATVVVLIEPENTELEINQQDLRIDVYRSSGHGGQSVNTTDSAVRITYLPTGIVVTCQDERSQLKNKNKALRVLRARLMDKAAQQESKKISSQRRSQVGTGERSEKIRTYNFPAHRVTDHRVNLTLHRLESVLEGDLDEFSEALIKQDKGSSKPAN